VTNASQPIIVCVPLRHLLTGLQQALEHARKSDEEWDTEKLAEIVSREFAFLRPFHTVRVDRGAISGGDFEEILVIEYHPPALRDAEASERRFRQATKKAERGHVRQAQPELRKLVQEFPEVAKYHRALGQAHFVLGEHEEAEDEFLRSLALHPTDPDALTLLGNLYVRRGFPAKAIPLYQQSLASVRNVYALTNLGAAFAETGRLDEAIDSLREAVREDAKHPNAWFGLGLALSRKEDHGASLIRVLSSRWTPSS